MKGVHCREKNEAGSEGVPWDPLDTKSKKSGVKKLDTVREKPGKNIIEIQERPIFIP